MGPRQAHLIYEFGEFQLDALRRVLSLSVDEQPLHVTGKVLDTLLYFVERAGQLLDKRTLMEALWPNAVVEESNLTQTIHSLRRVLEERPEEHRFIVTVPGRGYRFVADVRTRPLAGSETVAIKTLVRAQRPPPHRRKLFVGLAISAAVVATILGLLLVALKLQWDASRTPHELPKPSIAVLPFVDMSPNGDQEYFSDGLSEEILNLLAPSTALRVVARTSSFSFKNQSADIATIARKLNVSYVLEGSVRKSDDRVRITAQLVDSATSAHVWSQTYDRDVKDVLGVQTEIAAQVAEALQVTLTGGDRTGRGSTKSALAFEHYLQGRYFFNRRGDADLLRAKNYFEEALQIDPGYARAWAGFAGVHYVALDVRPAIPDVTLEKWHEAVERALALGPDLAEAQMRAAQYYWNTGDAKAADEHFNRALTIDPSDPLVLGASAGVAVYEGRLNDAISLLRRAVAVDPLSAVNRQNLGVFLAAVGDWQEAQAEFERALELNPDSQVLHAEIAKVLLLQHRFDESLALAQQLPEGSERDHCLVLVNYSLGNAAAAAAALARLIALAKSPDSDGEIMLWIAEVYAYRGDRDEAFRWLDQAIRHARVVGAVSQSWWSREEMQASPFLIPLRADARWGPLIVNTDRPRARAQLAVPR